MIPFDELIEKYAWFRQAAGWAKSTEHQTRFTLRELFTFAKSWGMEDLAEIGRNEIEKFLAEEHSLGIVRAYHSSPEMYMRTKASRLRPFFRWAVQMGLILQNPMEGLVTPKPAFLLPGSVLTQEEMKRLLEAPDTTTAAGLRNRAVLELMYSSGLRRMEVTGLDLSDVDIEGRTAFIRQSKGMKDRTVPFGADAQHWLRRYLEESRPFCEWESSELAFFLAKDGLRLNKNRIFFMLKEYLPVAGITIRVTPHVLRHTCATHLIQAGADLRYVQELLGHSDIRTTQIYTHVAIHDLKEVHGEHHPRGRHHRGDTDEMDSAPELETPETD